MVRRTDAEAAPEGEPIYTRDEMLAAAATFGVSAEVVAGALRLAGRDSMTRSEAEAAIHRFNIRKV